MAKKNYSKAGTAGLVAGSLVTIGTWVLQEFYGIKMPAHVASAVTALLIVLFGWLASLWFDRQPPGSGKKPKSA